MLLRLFPNPTAAQPSPPTILFTLPIPQHPYTTRSLPLPPNLLAHRSVCLQEDIECPNVLLGEKSSWVSGIIEDVTFSLPQKSITVNLMNGASLTIPIELVCAQKLARVVHEVQMSFAPAEPVRAQSLSAISSSSAVPSTPRRSTSALLFSLLSPLISSPTPTPVNPQTASRAHRRAARSLLVDAYRQFVLPVMKDNLPSAYLPWAIACETTKKLSEYQQLREDIDKLLLEAGVAKSMAKPMRRRGSTSSCSSDSDSDDESVESDDYPITPATSIYPSTCSSPMGTRAMSSPSAFLLSIPPAHMLPKHCQGVYSGQLAKLTQIASRLQAIRKLNTRYEREEGKRRWLESLERGRLCDRALRRAMANGQFRVQGSTNAKPQKRSGLWRCISSDELERDDEPTHPAMMDSAISESESESDDEPVRRGSIDFNMPRPPIKCPSDENVLDLLQPFRSVPVLDLVVASIEDMPTLSPSLSDDSLNEEQWDDEPVTPTSPVARTIRLPAPPLPPRSQKRLLEVVQTLEDVETEDDGGIRIVTAY